MSDMPVDNPLFQILGDNEAGSEQDFEVTVEDLRPAGGKGARVTLRLPPRLVSYIAGLAHSNGRSWAAECQAALEAHEALSRLSSVRDQDLQERRKKASRGVHGVTGKRAERFAEMLRDDLARIWATSFGTAERNRAFVAKLFAEDES
jgi:hypothetical protein